MREATLRREDEIKEVIMKQADENTRVLADRVSALVTELESTKEYARKLAETNPVVDIAQKLEDCERVLETTVEEHKNTMKKKEEELSNRLQAEVNSKNLMQEQINKTKALIQSQTNEHAADLRRMEAAVKEKENQLTEDLKR